MGSMTTLPRSRAMTRADLDAMPDDGHRYELVDGALLVTPAPSWRHQRVVARLWAVLSSACPAHLEVFVAPLDVALGNDTVLQPDVLVARRADLGERDLPAAPVLAVEVLSPSTRRVDLTLKKAVFEAAGSVAYWVVDPEVPSITVWESRAGTYARTSHVIGEDEHVARQPYPVIVRPSELVRD